MAKTRKPGLLPEWAMRITALRKRLHISQGEFARGLECSSMTVSRWERGLLMPSAHYYVQLGKLATGPDSWFFWGQAGLQVADITRGLPGVGQSKLRLSTGLDWAHAGGAIKNEAASGALVPLPLLKATAGTHGGSGAKLLSLDRVPATKLMGAPAEWCPNPSYTSLLRVKGESMEPLIRDGDILAVDSFQTEQANLNGKIVVAASDRKGLCVSRLRHYKTFDVLESENREYESVVLGKGSGWRIIGRVLWWISAAP